jgi:hypothetical membrane protein
MTEADTLAAPDSAEHPQRSVVDEPPRALRVGATCLVIIPIITAVIRSLRNDWFPIGDNALLFMRTADVWTENHPFLGSWTSASLSVGENMNNPGALYDWLIAPFAHLLPPGPATAIGVATLNIAFIAGISAMSHRLGGWMLQRWSLLFVSVLAWSMGSELLIDIWQPNALVFAFLLFLLLAVGLASGDDYLLPLAAAVGTLLLQTHISHAYIFIFVIAGAIGARVWIRPPTNWRRPVGISAVVLAILWAPSVWEQLFGAGKGNIARLLGNSSGGDLTLGFIDATRVIGSVASLPPWWARSSYTETVPITRLDDGGELLDIAGLAPLWLAGLGLLLVIGLLVVLTRLARRHDLRVQTAAGVIATVTLMGSVLALSQLTIGRVGLSPHHVRWVWPMMVFVHLTAIWLIVSVWRVRRPDQAADRRHGILIIGIVAITTILNIPFLAQPSGPVFEYRLMPIMRQIEPSIEQLDEFEPVLYDVSNLRIFEPFSSTMMMWMQERGIEFRVDDEIMIRQLGESRRADGTETTRVFQLQGPEARLYDGPGCVLGLASVLAPADEVEMSRLVEQASIELAVSIDAIVNRDVAVPDLDEGSPASLFNPWVDTAYALVAEGDACDP